MADKRKITKEEKQITKDLMMRSNYSEEEAKEIAKVITTFGYTVHKQENEKLKKVIKLLKKKFNLYTSIHFDGDVIYYWLDYETDLTVFTLNLTKEEYALITEVLENA